MENNFFFPFKSSTIHVKIKKAKRKTNKHEREQTGNGSFKTYCMSSLFLNHDVNILGFFFSNDVFECWRQREKDIQRVGERKREKKGNQIKLRMINRNNKKI